MPSPKSSSAGNARDPVAADTGTQEAPASFEAALTELERLVATMESGKLTLDEALAAHKRGLDLARHCQAALAQAREQVRILEEETLKVFPGADANNG